MTLTTKDMLAHCQIYPNKSTTMTSKVRLTRVSLYQAKVKFCHNNRIWISLFKKSLVTAFYRLLVKTKHKILKVLATKTLLEEHLICQRTNRSVISRNQMLKLVNVSFPASLPLFLTVKIMRAHRHYMTRLDSLGWKSRSN